jgi:hypothetical protein
MTEEKFGILMEVRNGDVDPGEPPDTTGQLLTNPNDDGPLLFVDRAEAEHAASMMDRLPHATFTVVSLVRDSQPGKRWGILCVSRGCVPDVPPSTRWVLREDGNLLTFQTAETAVADAMRRQREERAFPKLGTQDFYALQLPDAEGADGVRKLSAAFSLNSEGHGG